MEGSRGASNMWRQTHSTVQMQYKTSWCNGTQTQVGRSKTKGSMGHPSDMLSSAGCRVVLIPCWLGTKHTTQLRRHLLHAAPQSSQCTAIRFL